MAEQTYLEAGRAAVAAEMRRDPAVWALGEDLGRGGVFGQYKGLIDEFGPARIVDTPISEACIMGAAVGAAMMGTRPVVEMRFSDFALCAVDELVNQAAKARYMFGGQTRVPLVVRQPIGMWRSSAAQHSQSLEAWYTHIPGLVVVTPATPADNRALLQAAIRCDDPVVYMEHKDLWGLKGDVPEVAEAELGKARTLREGQDVTLVSWSAMVHEAAKAAELAAARGISVELIDLRTLWPWDRDAVLGSVARTGRLLVVHEAVVVGGFGAEVAATVAEACFDQLRAPVRRLGAPRVPIGYAPSLENQVRIFAERDILPAIEGLVGEEPLMSTNEMTGGEALARMIHAHGAPPMFGMGGFQLLPFYDAVRRLGLTHTLINDERCGAFAADAYARVTGRVGVCDATLGPGATNLITALVESLNAGVPVVALVGDTHRAHSWKNMTQESRQLEILRPAVKEVLRVERIERVPELVRRAFAIATTGRPGPVVLDVPEDVAHDTHGFDPDELTADETYTRAPALRCRPDWDAVRAAAALLARAERPIILAGGGVHLSGAAEALQGFAEDFAIPVAHTLSGKGAIACTHPLSAGIFGRYSRIANDLIEAADCILVFGCKLGEIATKRYTVPPAGKTLIHVDIAPEEIGRCYPPTVALWGDARATIEDLTAAMPDEGMRARQDHRIYKGEVRERMAAWRESVAARLASDEVPINMARLMAELNQALPADGILIADGGFAAHWGGLLFDTKRPGRSFVPDRGFASIGYGVPGAIGARLGAPDRPVAALTGDGGLNMTLGELETARRLGQGFALIVVNNAASGYVKALQHLMYGAGAYQSSDLSETDYAATARALGCHGIRVERPEDLKGALTDALTERTCPTVVDVVVTRDPSAMLPGVDARATQAKKGDRVA